MELLLVARALMQVLLPINGSFTGNGRRPKTAHSLRDLVHGRATERSYGAKEQQPAYTPQLTKRRVA
jgi:hypothetical protein